MSGFPSTRAPHPTPAPSAYRVARPESALGENNVTRWARLLFRPQWARTDGAAGRGTAPMCHWAGLPFCTALCFALLHCALCTVHCAL